MNKFLAPVLVSVLIFGSFSAQARGQGWHRPHPKKAGFMREMFANLNLTEEQKTQLAEIRKKKMESMKPLREKSKEARKSFFEKLKSDTSEEDIRKAHSELATLRTQKADARFENMLAVRRVLTPEQRIQLAQNFKNRKWNKDADDAE